MPYEEAARRWLRLPGLSPRDRTQLKDWLQDSEALAAAFGTQLTFGTAGLRGRMGPGPAYINSYTVAWTSAGVAEHLSAKKLDQRPIVIARDSRRQSDVFAEVAARVFVAYGFPVLYWQDPTPSPALSWAVREYHASAGIVITASHNPAQDNGYKVYNHHGGQILSDDAEAIAQASACYLKGEKSLLALPDFQSLIKEKRLQLLGDEALTAYLDRLYEEAQGFLAPDNSGFRIVYSPLHGNGSPAVPRLLRRAGFEVHEVLSQREPDGSFPTLSKPNPEDPAAFKQAIELGQELSADLLLLSDPDTDRLGAAYTTDSGYKLLSGNQIAALMLDFLTSVLESSHGLLLTSTVSSPFVKRLASARGLVVEETLTGFKYMGERISHLKDSDPPFFFAFEESYGYLFGSHARDKDGVMAALLMAACFQQAFAEGHSLGDRLRELYEELGYFEDRLENIDLQNIGGRQAGFAFLDRLRKQPPRRIADRTVLRMRDYAQGIDDLPRDHLLQFDMEDDSVLALRPSGTEPLLKFYINARGSSPDRAQRTADAYARAFHERLSLP